MTVNTSNTAQDTQDPAQEYEESILPKWMTRYLQFRFDLLDRTGKLMAFITCKFYVFCKISICIYLSTSKQ